MTSPAVQPPKTAARALPEVRIFEPALCCSTGVCGDDVDQRLVEFTADLHHLVERGADIERHNLANDPAAFATNENVRRFLEIAGSAGLPLTTVDGVTVATGSYPSRAQLEAFCGLDRDTPVVPTGTIDLGLTESTNGCGPAGCC